MLPCARRHSRRRRRTRRAPRCTCPVRQLRRTGMVDSTPTTPPPAGGGRGVLTLTPIIHPLFCEFCSPTTGLLPSATHTGYSPRPIAPNCTQHHGFLTTLGLQLGRATRTPRAGSSSNGQTDQTAGPPRTPALLTPHFSSLLCSGCARPSPAPPSFALAPVSAGQLSAGSSARD